MCNLKNTLKEALNFSSINLIAILNDFMLHHYFVPDYHDQYNKFEIANKI